MSDYKCLTTLLNRKIGKFKDKLPNESRLVKKRNDNAKISDIQAKEFTTFGYDN